MLTFPGLGFPDQIFTKFPDFFCVFFFLRHQTYEISRSKVSQTGFHRQGFTNRVSKHSLKSGLYFDFLHLSCFSERKKIPRLFQIFQVFPALKFIPWLFQVFQSPDYPDVIIIHLILDVYLQVIILAHQPLNKNRGV